MNPAFDEVLAAGSDAMLSAFDTTAQRLGTASQNIEKDFWVCWTLDALFHGLKQGGPRLLFKGGTSLSKGFGLINRFSEDIDVTVFRDDIGEPATIEELEALSGNKRRARLDAIKDACQAYINGPLRAELTQTLQDRLRGAGPRRGPGGRRRRRSRRPDAAGLVSGGDAAIGLCAGGDQDRVGSEIGARSEQRSADQAICRR
jgi:Nucleotidyl transferase AbiEii toxin, Type IV TA system